MNLDLSYDPQEELWENRYRPQTIADCILPSGTKKVFDDIIKSDVLDNLLLTSYQAGTGKTTCARALLNDMGYTYKFLAAGKGQGEGGIQAMRDIEDYASAYDLEGRRKAVIIDEADNLTIDAQKALRNIIEAQSKRVRFILTCNYPENLIEPLRNSRLDEIVFENPEPERKVLMKKMIKRCIEICNNENVTIESNKAIASLVSSCYPDNRRTIKKLAKYGRGGVIDEGIIGLLSKSEDITDIVEAMKSRNFMKLRQIAPEYKNNISRLLINVYRQMFPLIRNESKSDFIDIIGEVNFNSKNCEDTEIAIIWMFTNIMTQCDFI